MNPHLILARRRAGLHPEYLRAVQAKPAIHPEIHTYPTSARWDAEQGGLELTVPADPIAPEPAPRAVCGWLVAAYIAVGLTIWVVAATVPGA